MTVIWCIIIKSFESFESLSLKPYLAKPNNSWNISSTTQLPNAQLKHWNTLKTNNKQKESINCGQPLKIWWLKYSLMGTFPCVHVRYAGEKRVIKKKSLEHVSEEVRTMEAFPNWDSRSNETPSACSKPTESWLGFTIAEEMCSGVARAMISQLHQLHQ